VGSTVLAVIRPKNEKSALNGAGSRVRVGTICYKTGNE
jgi:hypothetical protein